MTAGGMPTWSLLKPLAMLALMVGLGISTVNHFVGPWSQRMLKDLVVQVRTDLMAQVIQPWRFTSPEAKLTVHIRDRAPDGDPARPADARCPRPQADRHLPCGARPASSSRASAAYLRMDKGHIVRPHREGGVAADHRLPALCGGCQPARAAQRSDRGHPAARALHRPSCSARPEGPRLQVQSRQLRIGAARALCGPLYAFAFVLVVLAFMGQAQTTRTSRLQAVISAFAVAVACRMLGIGCANLVAAAGHGAPALCGARRDRAAGRDCDPMAGLSAAAARGSRAPSPDCSRRPAGARLRVRWRLMPARAARARS